MADRGDTHYPVSSLNKWFLVTSLLLLVTTVWMVIDDYDRPWKQFQRRFREIEVALAEGQLAELEQEGALATEEELQALVDTSRAALEARNQDLAEALEELRLTNADFWRRNEDAKKQKAGYNWDRFLIEEARRAADDLTLDEERLSESEGRMNSSALAAELAEQVMQISEARVAELRADLEEAESALAGGTRDLERVRQRLQVLAPTAPAEVLAQKIRDDIPGLDFIGPTIQVRKVLPPGLTFELNFTKKQRIDMCHTCHMGIDRSEFEDVEQPFATHPRLDLYLTAKSAHPLKEVGCTICHRGSGEALDFIRADHRPRDEEQEHEWAEEYHWHKQHHWDYPMLSSNFIEASCVQCHKTSMELIADDAPRVSEGYRLFERYGCYSCHKVDWFPTTRKTGPSLENLQAKLDPNFVGSWIADPRGFRPTTWMPQIFHLENFAPDEPVVNSNWGAGREILGQEWSDTLVASVLAFILDTAPKQELPPVPVEGDAYRGREVMRVSGCFACHNVAPWDGEEPRTLDPTLVARGENEFGPNLRGVATKLNATWLFHWIQDPASIWPETRMPDLRLSDQDAADITAYVMEDPDGIYRDVPEGWDPQPIPWNLDALQEQARWFYNRDGRSTVEARLEGEDPEFPWDDPDALKIAVGEKIVAQYGCFSCHDINGMQDMMAIGTELSNWGSKTVDRLDFGLSYKKDLGGRPKLGYEYREGWLMRKLSHPRSYDLEKVKNPTEKLRMGWFDFTEHEVEALTTFVIGMVDDEVQLARMEPDPAQVSIDTGQRAVRQNNCAACHMLEPGTVTYRDEDGVEHTVQAQVLAFEDQVLPPRHDDLMAYIEEYAEEDGVEEVGFQLLRDEPDVGAMGSRLFVALEDFLAVTPAEGGDFVNVVTDYYLNGGVELFDEEAEDEDEAYYFASADPEGEGAIEDVDGQFRAYWEQPYEKVRWTFAPPVLLNEGHKVRPEWFYSFLNSVEPIRPQIRTRMPSFRFDPGEVAAIVDYFANDSVRGWPARYARALRTELGLLPEELGAAAGISPKAVLEIEDGYQPTIQASFDRLLAHGLEQGFAKHPPVDTGYEAVQLRSPTYLAAREADLGSDPIGLGRNLAVDAVNCFQCHFRLGQPPPDQPIAWAPDLGIAHQRLRADWVHEWLVDPQAFYPGTSMPANFSGDPPQYQEQYPDSTNEQQLQAVLDWLYNLDQPDVLERAVGRATRD